MSLTKKLKKFFYFSKQKGSPLSRKQHLDDDVLQELSFKIRLWSAPFLHGNSINTNANSNVNANVNSNANSNSNVNSNTYVNALSKKHVRDSDGHLLDEMSFKITLLNKKEFCSLLRKQPIQVSTPFTQKWSIPGLYIFIFVFLWQKIKVLKNCR